MFASVLGSTPSKAKSFYCLLKNKDLPMNPNNNLSKLQNQLIYDWLFQSAEWKVFAITVVFKKPRFYQAPTVLRELCLRDYEKTVIPKLMKRLHRNPKKWTSAMPFHQLYVYEYDHHRMYKTTNVRASAIHSAESSNPKPQPVPHIHGVIAIRNEFIHRLFNKTNGLSSKVIKDLITTAKIRSVEIAPIELDRSFDWFNYIAKLKTAKEFSF